MRGIWLASLSILLASVSAGADCTPFPTSITEVKNGRTDVLISAGPDARQRTSITPGSIPLRLARVQDAPSSDPQGDAHLVLAAEPNNLMLFGTGLAGIAAIIRRRVRT